MPASAAITNGSLVSDTSPSSTVTGSRFCARAGALQWRLASAAPNRATDKIRATKLGIINLPIVSAAARRARGAVPRRYHSAARSHICAGPASRALTRAMAAGTFRASRQASRRGSPMSRNIMTSVALFVLAVAMMPFATTTADAQATLFEGARLIPGDGTPPIENSAILVESGTITRIGRKGDVALPAGARRVDLDGKTVMPAILSPHVHAGFQRGLTYLAENYAHDTIMDDLNRALYFGVSTVMSLGVERGDVLFDMRTEQAAGRLGGARLYLAGRGIGAPNAGPGNPIYADFAYSLTTEGEGRRAVQEQAARKVDIIKFWVDDRGGRAPKLSIPTSRAIIDEAHKHGLQAAVHIFYHDDAVALAAARVNVFAHLARDTGAD